MIDVVEDVVVAIAETAQRPAYVEVKEQGAISRGGSRPISAAFLISAVRERDIRFPESSRKSAISAE